MRKIFLFFTLLIATITSCSSQSPAQPAQTHALDAKHIVIIADSTQAAARLLVDSVDLFFDRVTPCEMSIQMKRPLVEGEARSTTLPLFTAFLQADMANFTQDESKYVLDVMKDIFSTCQSVSDRLFPDTLILIKTKGRHYGDGVYYTRQNVIVIPADVLKKRFRKGFKSTMYHELFHVYSRLNPEKRAQLYRLIGFESVGLPKLTLPEPLAKRILHNPDGVDFAQRIQLKSPQGESIWAIPIIHANQNSFESGKNEFFAYLEFALFEIKPETDGTWTVETMTDGLSSTVDMAKYGPDFYRQIRDNTGYIIHPDEVLADNFSFLMLDKDGEKASWKFSKEGKALLIELEQALKN